MINTVVFDIGNVLIDFRWQGLFEDLGFCGEKFERIADATVRSQWWNEFDKGIMSLEEIIQKFTENAPEYEKEICTVLGPAPCAVPKINYNFRYRLTLRCRMSRNLRLLIAHLLRQFSQDKLNRKVSAFADVNGLD